MIHYRLYRRVDTLVIPPHSQHLHCRGTSEVGTERSANDIGTIGVEFNDSYRGAVLTPDGSLTQTTTFAKVFLRDGK